jgi:aspartate kinase
LIILKFGGTSLADGARIRRAVSLVTDRIAKQPIVVVSALSGVTDMLIALGRKALTEPTSADPVRDRHRAVLGELDLPTDLLDDDLEELDDLLRGVGLVNELSARSADSITSFGERLSCRIVAAHLEATGHPAAAVRTDRAGLLTDSRYGSASVREEAYTTLPSHLRELDGTLVLTGFLGHDEDGNTTTLGRGGSDFTAAIVGRAMGAREIQIWTDVDGVMTANPTIVPTARTIEVLSFAEASELAYYGAKVVHPATMIPAVRENIPIRVLNTLRPEGSGTLVLRDCGTPAGVVKSIASKGAIILIHITSSRMLLHHGFLARIFEIFGRLEIVIDMIATSEVSVSVTTDSRDAVEAAVTEISTFAQVEVEEPMGIICLVGEGIRHTVGTPGRIFGVLAEENISVRMISMGAGGTNISMLVNDDEISAGVGALHRVCFEGSPTSS